MTKTSCGPIYFEGLRRYTRLDDALMEVFAAGYVTGQAEKLYLGACRAAMFRPSQREREFMQRIAVDVGGRYGLVVVELPTAAGVELWLCRPEDAHLIEDLPQLEENSPAWHRHRGWLCGVPVDRIDESFHLRKSDCDWE